MFTAAARVMSRLGPAQLTLAEIAAEAGLTAGALVQRFGSKRDLLAAMMEPMAAATPGFFARLRVANRSPLAALRAYAACVAALGDPPGMFAHHLAWLQLDLADPVLHRHLRAQALATRAEIEALLRDAKAARELAGSVDEAALARAVEVTLSGSLMVWAVHQDGTAAERLREDLDALLRPYLAPRP
ncbi:MAG TPA: helix-turn-helix domain-containing protein [Longimicrobium sp.]|nr:helix-turn-helix domain-containing protein [Longimicrobium sp.]